MPGVLPVINRRAVEFAVRTALAFGLRVNAACRFARKNYYYPDLPKGYQITQYEEPLAEDGGLEIETPGRRRAGSASSGCTSRRTPASSSTRATLPPPRPAWSTTTARACR